MKPDQARTRRLRTESTSSQLVQPLPQTPTPFYGDWLEE